MKNRIVSLLLLLFVLAIAISVTAETITITKDGNVRSGPTTTENVIGKVKAGEKFDQIDKSGEWFKIRLSTGSDGWVNKVLIESNNSKTSDKKSAKLTELEVAQLLEDCLLLTSLSMSSMSRNQDIFRSNLTLQKKC